MKKRVYISFDELTAAAHTCSSSLSLPRKRQNTPCPYPLPLYNHSNQTKHIRTYVTHTSCAAAAAVSRGLKSGNIAINLQFIDRGTVSLLYKRGDRVFFFYSVPEGRYGNFPMKNNRMKRLLNFLLF